MIPVRVPADTTVHHVKAGLVFSGDHPMVDALCPVCDLELGNGPVTLVYVGAHPNEREGRFWTGAAVAVHDACAAPPAGGVMGAEEAPHG